MGKEKITMDGKMRINLNQFAVIGLGRFGSELVRALSDADKEVLAIDVDSEKVKAITEVATHAITADATDEKVLRTVKIDSIDAVIVAIGDIEASILTVMACKELGVKHVVAKASGEKHKQVLEKVGADYVIIPEAAMAHKLAGRLVNRRLNDLMEVNENYSIIEVDVPSGWSGKSLIELDVRKRHKVNVILVLVNGKEVLSSPGGETILNGEDRIIVGGTNDDIARFAERLSKMK